MVVKIFAQNRPTNVFCSQLSHIFYRQIRYDSEDLCSKSTDNTSFAVSSCISSTDKYVMVVKIFARNQPTNVSAVSTCISSTDKYVLVVKIFARNWATNVSAGSPCISSTYKYVMAVKIFAQNKPTARSCSHPVFEIDRKYVVAVNTLLKIDRQYDVAVDYRIVSNTRHTTIVYDTTGSYQRPDTLPYCMILQDRINDRHTTIVYGAIELQQRSSSYNWALTYNKV